MTTYTKKFKEFIEDYNPKSEDYVVGYRGLDNGEVRIPLVSLDNSITANKYIRKDIDDYANGVIRFNKGFTTSSNVMSTIYLQGMDGWFGNSNGDFEMNSLTLREFLEVPELRKNKITVMGNQFWFTDSAMTKEVVGLGLNTYNILLKLEDGEYGSFELDDILKGIYHYNNGFYTVYLQVYELILDGLNGGEVGVKVRSLNGRDPQQAMLLARVTNSKDLKRQGSIFADGLNKYIRVINGYSDDLKNVEGYADYTERVQIPNPDDPTGPPIEKEIYHKGTLKVQMGDLSGIKNHPLFGSLEGYGLYADNVYLTGKLIVKNDPNAPGQELGVYRGQWSSTATYYKYDQVTYNGSLFTSKAINNKGNIPTGQIDDIWWELTVAKGENGDSGVVYTLELSNDNHTIPTDYYGQNPSYGGANSTAYVFAGTTDITDIYTITARVQLPATPETLSIVQNDNTVTITYIADTLDAAAVVFTATADGYPTLTKTWSISKVKAGNIGDPAIAYWLVTDTPVIKKFKDGIFKPSPFVIRAYSQIGNTDIQQYQGFIRLTYGSEVQVISGSIYQFTPSADVESYTIELYQDALLKTLLDKEIVSVVEDGADGISPYILNLDNDAALVPADVNGIVLNYDLAVTNAVLYIGQTKLDCTFEVVILEPEVTYTMSPEGRLQITYMPKGIDIINVQIHAVMEKVRVSSAVFTVSKVKPGADGSPALIYQLQPSVNVVKRDKDGVLSTNTITVEVLKYVGSELPVIVTDCYIRFKLGEDAGWTTYLDGIILRDETQVINIELYDKQDGTLFDAETIPVIFDGKPGENGTSSFKSIVFLRSNNKPTAPIGGSYLSPVPAGWSDGAPVGLEILWMSSRVFSNTGLPPQTDSWTEPTEMTNTASFEAYYSSVVDNPGNPTTYPHNWYAIASPNAVWFATRTMNNGVWSDWSVSKIKGETGEPGKPGEPGIQGPSIVFAGIWLENKQYYCYKDTQTAIKYNGKYYYTKTVSATLSPLTIPTGAVNNPSSESGKIYWNEFVGQFDNIATGLLLAERIGTAELTANKIFIVDRDQSSGDIVAANGSIITKDEEKNLSSTTIMSRLTKGWFMDQGVIRSIATTADKVTPKLKLDSDGTITATGVNVTGTVHFENGTIGSMQVFNSNDWTNTVNGPYPASTGYYYLRKSQGVTITPQGHIIGKDYFLTGDSNQGPSVFVGDVYVPGYDVPGMDNTSLSSFLKLWNSLFEKILIGNQYHIKAKLPLFSIGEITAYGSDGMSVESIWASIPVDKKTIDLIDGKLTVVGGIGGIKGIVLPAMTERSAFTGATLNMSGDTITFVANEFMLKTDTPDLSNYVTLNTVQTIIADKIFYESVLFDSKNYPIGGFARGLHYYNDDKNYSIGGIGMLGLNGVWHTAYIGVGAAPWDNNCLRITMGNAHLDMPLTASSFIKSGGTSSQLLRADGGVATFNYAGNIGQPEYVWGVNGIHDYALWNPANFRVANANTVGDVGVGNLVWGYSERTHALLSNYYDGNSYVLNYINPFRAAFMERGSWSYANNGYVITDWGNIHLAGTAITTWGATNNFTSLYITPLDAAVSNPLKGEMLFYSQNGAGYNKGWRRVLTSANWTSVVDGRYLPLTGGPLSGLLNISNGGLHVGGLSANSEAHIRIANSGSGRQWGIKSGWFQVNETAFTIIDDSSTTMPAFILHSSNQGASINGNLFVASGKFHPTALPDITLAIGDSNSGFNWEKDGQISLVGNGIKIGHWTSGGLNFVIPPKVNDNVIWHAGNDGAGSGLDADLLDGYHLSMNAGANTVVGRDQNGHMFTNYINSNTGNDENPNINQIITTTGDGYYRKSNIYHLKSQLRNAVQRLNLLHLDPNTWYPCTMLLSISVVTKIRISNTLNGNRPAWATHELGFTMNLEWDSIGSEWGATSLQKHFYSDFVNFTLAGVHPCGGISSVVESSEEIVWLRGGALYDYYTDGHSSFMLHETDYIYGQGGQHERRYPLRYLSTITPPTDHAADGIFTTSFICATSNIRTRLNNQAVDSWPAVLDHTQHKFYADQMDIGVSNVNRMLGWRDVMPGIGYLTSYSIASRRSSGWGEMIISIGTSDSNTTGRQLLLSGNGDMMWSSGNFIVNSGSITVNGIINASGRVSAQDFLTSYGNWFRSQGDTGWLNETHGIGLFARDSTYLRVYGGAKFYVTNGESDSILTAGGVTAGSFTTGGRVTANSIYCSNSGEFMGSLVSNSNISSQSFVSGQRFYTGYDSGAANSVNCSNWFRSSGSTGWLNTTYGGGIYMEDGTWVRVWNGKSFWCGSNILAQGEVTAYGSASDMRLKTIIESEYDALSDIMRLSTFKYKWNDKAKSISDIFNDNDTHYGVSAQELQQLSGYLVSNAKVDNTYLIAKKEELVPLLLKGMQQMLKRIEQLEYECRNKM